MKKLLLIAATSAAILTSTSFADLENSFYVKANVGGLLLSKSNDKMTGIKMKAQTAAFGGLGVGYYVMDNVRTDLAYDHYFNAKLKKSANNISAEHKADLDSLLMNAYVDAFDVSVANIFLGGGVGVAMLKEKVSNTIGTASSKKSTNFAYALVAGASFELAEGAKTEISYNWRDFGQSKSQQLTDTNGKVSDTGKTHYRGHNLVLGFRFDM